MLSQYALLRKLYLIILYFPLEGDAVFTNNQLPKIHSHAIEHLHAGTKEIINTLIVVMSQLDTVVASMNILNPMENR